MLFLGRVRCFSRLAICTFWLLLSDSRLLLSACVPHDSLHNSQQPTFQGHPTTVFGEISVRSPLEWLEFWIFAHVKNASSQAMLKTKSECGLNRGVWGYQAPENRYYACTTCHEKQVWEKSRRFFSLSVELIWFEVAACTLHALVIIMISHGIILLNL